jgi:hypothetical protein
MAVDITEDLAVDLSASTAGTTYTNRGITYDISINDQPFRDASTSERPSQRETAQYRKDQSDNSAEPGEQSLVGWWMRSQSSFHYGAGIKFYEPAQDEKLRYRFADSQGVDVWTQGEVSLLNKVEQAHRVTTTDTGHVQLRPIQYVCSGKTIAAALLHDGYDLDKVYAPITASVTNKALTSNVATLTAVAHGFTAGMEVVVTGVDATFNGTYTITTVATDTFSYAKTAADVASTAVSPAGAAVSNVTHFVEFVSGVSSPILFACDDGEYAYFVSTDTSVSPVKTYTYKKPLAGDATTGSAVGGTVTGDVTIMFFTNNVTDSGISEWVKGRIISAVTYNASSGGTSKVFELTRDSAALPTAVFTAPKGTVFTDITSSAADIFISGYIGDNSMIWRLPLETTGAFTSLTAGVVVAELPRGEIVHSIQAYLGYIAIGTSKGVRIGQLLDAGGIVYGPLLFNTVLPVYDFASNDRFLWAASQVGTDAGLVRIDLGTQVDTLRFAYANDLQADGVPRVVGAVAFLNGSASLAFATVNNGSTDGAVYTEKIGELRETGYITTGRIRYNTTEDKYFKFVKERADYAGGGSIAVGVDGNTVSIADGAYGNQDIAISGAGSYESRYFTFTLRRNALSTGNGPVLSGYQVKALPASRRQRLIQYVLYCYDNDTDRLGNKVGYKGRAYARLLDLEDLEATSNIVRVQDFRTGEAFDALIEQISFVNEKAPSGIHNGFGGILRVTVRKL